MLVLNHTRYFRFHALVLGGLLSSPCQDQPHWLRKLVKISLLSTKPLLFGAYPAAFAHLVAIYELGSEYGLLKADTDIHNKIDQLSAERIISKEVADGLRLLP